MRWGGGTPCWAAVVLAAACSRSGDDRLTCSGVSGAAITRTVEHAGAGHELTVRLRFQDGVPIGEADLVGCFSVDAPASTAPPVVTARSMAAAYTLILVDPGVGRRDTDFARGLVEQLAGRRPVGEAVAVYRWGAELTQVAPFATDRKMLLDRLPIGMVGAETVVPVRTALATAASVLAAVGGPAADALRTIVLVSPRAAAMTGFAEALPAADPHLVMWIGGSDQSGAVAALAPGLRFGIPANTVPASVVASLSDRLDAYKRYGHYAIGLCGGEAAQTVRVAFREATTTPVVLAAPMAENQAGACQPEALAAGRRAFPRRLELLFTDGQRAQAAAAHDDREQRPSFALAVRVGPAATPTPATARYRADAGYACARRSYTIELDGVAPRFLFPGFASSKFHLLSMCLDRLYLRTATTLALMAEEGLFPVPFDLVELVVDGVSQGPYLAFEDAAESLRVHNSRVTAVLRPDPAGVVAAPQVQFSATTADDAVASYQGILDATAMLSGQRLENALRDRLDFDRYLNWVALMNLIASGGHADELFFFAVETTGADGLRSDFHLMMGLEQAQAFASCAGQGRALLVDRNGLLDCSGGALDQRIFVDPLLYTRYTDQLEALVDRHPPERFAALVDATAGRLLEYLRSPPALAGLTELAAIDPDAATRPEVAQALLEAERELLITQYTSRRNALLAGLARWRATR
jgi:hypothetical protein